MNLRQIAPLSVSVAISLLFFTQSVVAYEFTMLASTETRSDQTGWSGSPITSDDDGNLYYAFMNPANMIEVGKRTESTGLIEKRQIAPLKVANDPHMMLAIAIDLNGYLHVIGPHHQNEMDYLVSNTPYSVTGGFTRQVANSNNLIRGLNVGETKSNGERAISYPSFFYDNNFNPIINFRFRVSNDGFKRQTQAAQMARYNSNTGLWEHFGGNQNPQYEPTVAISLPSPKIPAFIWSTQTKTNAIDDAYQAWGDRQHVDKNGRIHVAYKHFDGGPSLNAGGYGTDIIYFYSDDNGQTWRTADGSAIADSPIVVPSGPNANMYVRPNNHEFHYAYVSSGLAADGNPVVAYTSKQGTPSFRFSKWNGSRWIETNTGFRADGGDLKIDTNGTWYVAANTAVRVSTNDGQSWRSYSHGLPSSSRATRVDERYFKKTNKLRFVVRPAGDNTATFVEFVSDEWQPTAGSNEARPMPPQLALQ